MKLIPAPLLEFARRLALEGRSPAYLQLDPEGNLVASGGDLAAYGLENLRTGRPAAAQAHFLEGLIPVEDDPLSMPCLEIAPGRFADIHLLNSGQSHWVLLLDAGRKAALAARRQQRSNQDRLLAEEGERDRRRLESLRRLLADLDAAALEQVPCGQFRMLGNPPQWLDRLRFAHPACGGRWRPQDEMPFLENFLREEAEPHWERRSASLLLSGPWVEIGCEGEELELEAQALVSDGKRILLIQRLGQSHSLRKQLLQKARERTLHYQRLVNETRDKEVLLHCIVHDLGGPLTGLQGALTLLSREQLSPKGERRMATSMDAASRLQRLVEDVMDVFSSELKSLQGGAAGEVRPVDVRACAQVAADIIGSSAISKGIDLRIEDSVAEDPGMSVMADASRLERVLFNLLENALRYGPDGSAVTLRVANQDGYCRIEVDDRGPGVDPASKADLFGRFRSWGEKSGRSGIGLYFCRISVEGWGGSISQINLKPNGSRFLLLLPLCKGKEA